jgi:hypothetical protein
MSCNCAEFIIDKARENEKLKNENTVFRKILANYELAVLPEIKLHETTN